MRQKEYLWLTHVQRMMELCQKTISLTTGMNQDSFVSNKKVYDHALKNIELIGEYASYLPKEVFDLYPQVDWRELMVVSYILKQSDDLLETQSIVFWDIAESKVPDLLSILSFILESIGDRDLEIQKRA